MSAGRPSFWMLLIALAALGLVGCEPYMSMTDQIPAETRRAAALLPETPRYVGMVDVETALRHLDDLSGKNLTDSLRQTDHPQLRAFLDATGLDLKTDVQAAYGAIGSTDAFSAVLFANLTTEQVDRYLAEAPNAGERVSTYREVPRYRLTFGTADAGPKDTLSVAFVDKGMMAVATDAERTTAMVDRHKSKEQAGFGANEAYMTLVKRVGHGSTAWLVGRDVVETALQDSSSASESGHSNGTPQVSQAGLQHALAEWTDRMLGLSKVNASSFEEDAGEEVKRLRKRLREQAISVTLTDTEMTGEVYLTMRDNASASSVVDVAEGAVAVAKLSREDLDDRHRDLLDEIEIQRNGAIVHIQFSLDRERLRKNVEEERRAMVIRPVDPSIRPLMSSTRRLAGINHPRLAFQPAPTRHATPSVIGLSTPSLQTGTIL